MTTFYLYVEHAFDTPTELTLAAIDLARLYPDALIRVGDPTPVPVTVNDKARRNVSAANRRPSTRVLDNIEHTADIWMGTPCPYCQTNPGRPCVTPSGRDTGTHGARATLYRRSVDFGCETCHVSFGTDRDALAWHNASKHAAEPVDQAMSAPTLADYERLDRIVGSDTVAGHPCIAPRCDHWVAFDDEPYCFTHSPDEGSSVQGYSYKANRLTSPFPAVTLEEM